MSAGPDLAISDDGVLFLSLSPCLSAVRVVRDPLPRRSYSEIIIIRRALIRAVRSRAHSP